MARWTGFLNKEVCLRGGRGKKHTHVATASTASGTNEQKITTAPSCSRMPILIFVILISLH
jgi:hypothetical protein